MDIEHIREDLAKRARRVDPVVADAALAIGLAALVCLQIWLVTHVRPAGLPFPRGPRMMIRFMVEVGPRAYFAAAAVFLPLAFRRIVPWLAFLLSGLMAIVYSLGLFPPAFTVVGPMVGLYSLAAYTKRHNAMIALLIIGLVIAVPVLAFSGDVPRVAETVGTFALLTTAALLGDTARNRREYIAAVEARALEAERTRDEEALRRVEEERVRIARDVHDIVAHSLSIVTVQAAAAEAVLDRDPEQARESIRNIRATGREALGQLRSMLDVLRAGEGEATPLAPAADLTHVEQLIAPVRDAGLEVSLGMQGDLASVPAFASVSGYRIVQEALTNVVRHADARHVAVEVTASDRELRLRVADDGRGSAADDGHGGTAGGGHGAAGGELGARSGERGADMTAHVEAAGHGIRGMRERVEALGGTFSAEGRPEGGFEVTARIPLTRSAT